MGLERRRRAVVAADSTGKWRNPAATEKADHAQVEGSTAAPFPRDEPASDCPQLFDLAKHRPRLRFRRPNGWRKVAAAGGLGRPTDWRSAVSAATALARGMAQTCGTGLGRPSQGTANPQEPDPAT